MKFGENGINLLKEFEGIKTNMYFCPAGQPTIGIGHKLSARELQTELITIKGKTYPWKDGLTPKLIEDLNDQDTDFFEALIKAHVKVPLSQNQFDALVCFTFNIPISTFLSSTLLKKLNNKKYDEVPDQLKRFIFATDPKTKKKIKLNGLVRRRNAETNLWCLN